MIPVSIIGYFEENVVYDFSMVYRTITIFTLLYQSSVGTMSADDKNMSAELVDLLLWIKKIS